MKCASAALLAVAALGCRKVERGGAPAPPTSGARPAAARPEPPRRIDGPPVVLAQDQSLPVALALDNDAVYWTNYGRAGIRSGSIMRQSRSGGAPVVLADFETEPTEIALDHEFVYWTASQGSIRRVAKVGGQATTLTVAGGQPRGLAVGADAVFFCDEGQGTVSRLSKTSGKLELLASRQHLPIEVAVDGSDLYWLSVGSHEASLGSITHWHDGQLSVLASGLGTPHWLVAAGDDLFVAHDVPDPTSRPHDPPTIEELLRIDKRGGAVQVLLHGQSNHGPLAVDHSHLYFASGLSMRGWVRRIPRRGGNAEVVDDHDEPIGMLAVDPSGVYFIRHSPPDFHDGAIVRVPLAAP